MICLLAPLHGAAEVSRQPVVTWRLTEVKPIGGNGVELLGQPQPVTREERPGIRFDGFGDACVVNANPLTGLSEFTIEILFFPEKGGAAEQRFFHAQDNTKRRFLFELRVDESGERWCLDTFLFSDEGRLTLIDRTQWHPLARWYWASVTYRDGEMVHYVDGVREAAGAVRFPGMGEGQTSLGARLNRVHWFKGVLSEIRVFDRALPAGELSRVR